MASQAVRPGRRRARWPSVVAGLVVLLLALVVGAWLWVRHGWTVYGQANAAYRQGDCQGALPLYGRLHSYPRLAGPFVDTLHQEEAECFDYEVAAGLAAVGYHAGAISGWEQLRAQRPDSPLAPLALQAIVREYSAWACELRQAGDFQAALATSDQLASRHPDFRAQADTDVEATYLAWGDKLCVAGDYGQAAQVYDTMAARGEPFLQPARLAWAEVMLDRGAALAAEGAYAEAEAAYRTLLQREHGWLAPLSVTGWDAAGLQSYGQVWTTTNAPERPLHAGPGEQYATLDVTVAPGRDALDVVGASFDAGWYAVRLAEAVGSSLGWLPAGRAGRFATGSLGIPLSGVLVDVVASESDAATRAAEGLRLLYSAWAATVEPSEAVPLYASLAELASDQSTREAAWQQALEANLEAARVLMERGDYVGSTGRTLEVEAYDREGRLAVEARVLRAANRLALGKDALAGGEWERAIGDFEAVLALEVETYGVALVTSNVDRVLLREAPSAASAPVFAAKEGTQWPVLGRSGRDHPGWPVLGRSDRDHSGWILLLVPVAPTMQGWIASTLVTLSVPVEALPERDSAPLTTLYGHQARMGWLHASLGWADGLASNRDWEPALSLYQEVVDAAVPGSAEADSALEGALNARLGWASELAANRDWEPALSLYQAVSEAAVPGSAEAESGLDGTFRTRLAWADELAASRRWEDALTQYHAVVKAAVPVSAEAVSGLDGVFRTRMAWAEELAASRRWEDALQQYEAVVKAAVPGSAEAESGLDGVLRTRLAWAADLSAAQRWLAAVDQYLAVLEAAPEGSQPTVDALAGLESLAPEAERLAVDEPCQAVPLLDALAGTASAARTAGVLPEALLRCGSTLLETDQLDEAEAKYRRVLAEFPSSKQAAAAQRGLQRVAWVGSISEQGLGAAARAACEKAGASVQANVSTLDKPWVAYLSADEWLWGWLPSSLTGEERQTTVVVCIGEEQESQLEVRNYTLISGPDAGTRIDLYRMRYYRRVRLVDPVAGLTVAAGTIYGSQPDIYHETETFAYVFFTGKHYRYGDHPDSDDLEAWIGSYLKP